MKGVPPKTASSIATRLGALGVTAAAVAAAIAAGVGINDLVQHFESGGAGGAPGGGDYVPPEGEISIHDDPNYPGGGNGPYGPGPGPSPGGDGGELPWWSYTQNITAKDLRGRGRKSSGSDGRSARAAIVRRVMQEQGLTMTQASSYVKQNGLY